jgi:WXG100 family type VII secretion target
MTAPFSVDLDRMQTAIEQMTRFDTALGVHLERLDARIDRLHTKWSGDAAEAHRRAHKQWLRAARDMRHALQTLRSISETAHRNYQSAVAANGRMWDEAAS